MPSARPRPTPRHPCASLTLAAGLMLGAAVGGLCGLGCAPAQAQVLADPRVEWQTADSAHFRVHYRSSQRAQAQAVARAAERVYGRITHALAWEPRGRTEVVLYTEFDIANGYTTPLPYNKIGVFLAPPDEGQLLDNSNWLDLLLVHEFTHAVHLDKVRSVPGVLQNIFGRVPWFMPNLFQPGWATEGIATYLESDPANGRGRLKGPLFEAWLRAERASGFLSLREINADGRALPLSKQYLYGAYFYEFLARRYGADKPAALIEQYSGNIVPRLHSNPSAATGKTMDVLWDEFLADLAQQVDQRAAPLLALPETLGPRLLGPLFSVPSVAALPGGDLLAVLDDGVDAAQLVRLNADGTREALASVNGDARISVAADGRVLVAQYDVCNTLYLSYDLYRLQGDRLRQLTSCAHLRRAVDAGPAIVALQLDAGVTRLVRLGDKGSEPAVLYTPAEGADLIDLVASADGQRLTLIERQAGDWRLLELDLDLARSGATPRVLLRRNAPMHSLRLGPQGLEVIAADAGVHNVWRLAGGEFQRLTHSHTSVVAHSGTAANGTLATVVVAPQGFALHRMAGTTPLQTLPAEASGAAMPAVGSEAASAAPVLGEGVAYLGLRSLAPRWWLPAVVADRGLTAFGASTSGADALGWHQYSATAMVETSQKELIGALEYLFASSHGMALSRTLVARDWTGGKGKEETTVFDRHTRLQWLSLVPFTRLQQRFTLGLGAAVDRVDRVDVRSETSTLRRNEKVMAAIVDFDTRLSNWASEGVNSGLRATLQYESYKPFADGDSAVYSGDVLRGDLRLFLPLTRRSVLALRATEVHARGTTESYQLGGAVDAALQVGYVLNDRSLSLRGYDGDEAALRGHHARVGSIEWRTTLADVDRHFMVPPVGINRLSATLFADIGGAWDIGHRPATWHRSVGAELLAETRLLYTLGLQLRLGVARALDGERGTTGYLTLGRAF